MNSKRKFIFFIIFTLSTIWLLKAENSKDLELGRNCNLFSKNASITFKCDKKKPWKVLNNPDITQRVNIFFKFSQSQLLKLEFDLLDIFQFLKQYSRTAFDLTFVNGRALDVRMAASLANMTRSASNKNRKLRSIQFFDLNFAFYDSKKQRRINSCDDVLSLGDEFVSIFQMPAIFRNMNFKFLQNTFKAPICPLVFNHAIIDELAIDRIYDSFYRYNVIQFQNYELSTDTLSAINSNITALYLNDVLNIKLNQKIINTHVFKNLQSLYISGDVNSIEVGLLGLLKYLRMIQLDPTYIRKIFHRNGIEWLQCLNTDLDVNMSDFTSVTTHWPDRKKFEIRNKIVFYTVYTDIFPDKDFCLYVKFPFHRLIFIMYEPYNLGAANNTITCTAVWLFQHSPMYLRFWNRQDSNGDDYKSFQALESMRIDQRAIDSCNFEKRVEFCNRSNFKIASLDHDFADYAKIKASMIFTQFLLLATTPVVVLIGVATNVLVVVNLHLKANQEIFNPKPQHYNYMSVHSVICVLILVISLFNLMTECQMTGVFCSSLFK